ncbi:MAG: bifunctional phosphoribosyl-AMP cyclohydrolase/phosphoribosyl-ATP diphosphatase HisIE [Clostridia bacterium]|nr:bifunctional phosphoribosyl-AMP cyclohydrolase/phosphoribosyl-ATP diphosphatase HisIE [Clostridia bacterium]
MKWAEFKLNENGLLPVVVQDAASQQVVMMAYMDQAGFEETLESGEMVYYSRSRQARWKKGESSGNVQKVVNLAVDCDQDTLLATINQVGVACHTGKFSCFDGGMIMGEEAGARNQQPALEVLEGIIQDRRDVPVEGSYTQYLFEKGLDKILKKVGEETAEVIIAAKNKDAEELVYEVSDLLYHMMVLLNEQGVAWSDIEGSLRKRYPKSQLDG